MGKIPARAVDEVPQSLGRFYGMRCKQITGAKSETFAAHAVDVANFGTVLWHEVQADYGRKVREICAARAVDAAQRGFFAARQSRQE